MSDTAAASSPGQDASHALHPEDQARADFYALLAALYAGGPDGALLRAIARAPALGVPAFIDRDATKAMELASAWEMLRAASAAMVAEAAGQEYVELFVGVGKCEVNLHGSHWLTGFMMDKLPLTLTAACQEVRSLEIIRIQNASTRREPHGSSRRSTSSRPTGTPRSS